MSQPIVVAALYKFVTLQDYVELREPLLKAMLDNDVKGTPCCWPTKASTAPCRPPAKASTACWPGCCNDPRLADVDHKESYCDEQPFYRTKVKLKKEIVTLGVPGVDPNQAVGTYVEPKDWNALISDPEVLLIDTRNDYEVAIGTFKGAMDPKTENLPRVPGVHQGQLRPQQAQESGHVLHRRHSLRKSLQLHAR